MTIKTNPVYKLRELTYYNDKFEQIRNYLSTNSDDEITGDFSVPERAIVVDDVKLNRKLLKDYVENELINLRMEKAKVYQELGRYVEVEDDE